MTRPYKHITSSIKKQLNTSLLLSSLAHDFEEGITETGSIYLSFKVVLTLHRKIIQVNIIPLATLDRYHLHLEELPADSLKEVTFKREKTIFFERLNESLSQLFHDYEKERFK